MRRETYKWMVEMLHFSSLTFSISFSVVVGLVIGLFLDRLAGSSPYMMFIFLVLGIAAGFRNLGLVLKKSKKV